MCCIFSAVSRLISGLFCSARETVEDETFARRAMSLMEVGLCTGVPVPHTFAEIRVYSNLHLSACQLTVLLSLVCPEMPLCRYLPPDSSRSRFPIVDASKRYSSNAGQPSSSANIQDVLDPPSSNATGDSLLFPIAR